MTLRMVSFDDQSIRVREKGDRKVLVWSKEWQHSVADTSNSIESSVLIEPILEHAKMRFVVRVPNRLEREEKTKQQVSKDARIFWGQPENGSRGGGFHKLQKSGMIILSSPASFFVSPPFAYF